MIGPTLSNISLITVGLSDVTMNVVGLSDVTMNVVGLSDTTMNVVGLSDTTMNVVGLSDVTMNVVGLSDTTMNVVGLSDVTMNVVGLSDVTLNCDCLDGQTISLDCSCLDGQEIGINWAGAPELSVTWGTPPACNCTVSITCPTEGGQSLRALDYNDYTESMGDFQDGFDITANVQTTDLGIPSEIKIIAPKLPNIKVVHDLPTTLELKVPNIPDIRILGPEKPLPEEIKFVNAPKIPWRIRVDSSDLPKAIKVESDLPGAIKLEMPSNFPSSIALDASGWPTHIQVKGIPDSIELIHNLPSYIQLKVPENVEVPLVYRGGPVPLQLNMEKVTEELGDDCFRLVPCSKK